MKLRIPALLAAVMLLLAATAQVSQAQNDSPKGRVNQHFAAKSPALGAPLPDITIYDNRGKELALRSLKGRHAVITFGCLT